jgi:negative regulator of sigma E activity
MQMSALLLIIPAVAAPHSQQLPDANEVVARMMAHDAQRQSTFEGYTAFRRYVLEVPHRHKRAEMVVKMTCSEDGSKQFETVSETGWGAARKHVFPRLLESESSASLPNVREKSRITPDNYSFQMVGTDTFGQRLAYVMAITPKTENKYLIKGRIWVDAEDYAIMRIEGKPAKNPSFWTRSVHFVHTYKKHGSLWLPVADRSVTDVWILGTTDLTIDYFDYSPNTTFSASDQMPSRSMQ